MFTSITLFLAIFFVLIELFVVLLVLSWIVKLVGGPLKDIIRAFLNI